MKLELKNVCEPGPVYVMPPDADTLGMKRLVNAPRTAQAAGGRLFNACR